MAFSTYCNNKGCGKHMEPYIDPKTDKVYCSVCDGEITNITHFAKSQMKTLKQFRVKNKISFSVKCDKCGKEDRPKIVADQVVCSGCKKPLDNLSSTFKIMLKEQLKNTDKE